VYVYVCVYYMGSPVSSSCSPHGTHSNTSHHRHCGRDLQLQIAVHARLCMYSIDYIYFYLEIALLNAQSISIFILHNVDCVILLLVSSVVVYVCCIRGVLEIVIHFVKTTNTFDLFILYIDTDNYSMLNSAL
jgi:hypothetical protein